MAAPLLDLHLHLEGAIDARLAAVLYAPDTNPHQDFGPTPEQSGDWENFSRVYQKVAACLDSTEEISKLLVDLACRLRRAGVVYTEVIVSVSLLKRRVRIRDICDALSHGRLLARQLTGVQYEFQIGISRGDGARDSERMLRQVLRVPHATDLFCAINICGNEKRTADKTGTFVGCANIARSSGLKVVVHCGEFDSPEGSYGQSIRDAIFTLNADRLDHAIFAARFPDLVDAIKKHGVGVTFCPTSNASLGRGSYPYHEYLQYHIPVAIATDDPGMFATTLRDEFRSVWKVYRLSHDERRRSLLDPVQMAFRLSDDGKRRIKSSISFAMGSDTI